MNAPSEPRPRRAAAVLLLLLAALLGLNPAARAQSAPRRTQTIQLQRGWNAVYLEVIPTNTAPGSVFAGAPVNIVATYLENTRTVQFIRDPATIGWKKEGWAVWYAPQRPEAFLTTLFAVHGNRAYLVQAERACTLNVEGFVELARTSWKADSYNLVGFTLDPASPPTFEKFFGGSKAHQGSKVYRLENERWTLVVNPAGTVMRAGEAFWVETRGGSDYQGPLRVKVSEGNGVRFRDAPESAIVLSNESRDPASVVVETVGGSGPALPLSYAMRAITDSGGEAVEFDLSALHTLPTLESSARTSFRLRVRRDRMTSDLGATLLRFSNGAGAVVWVPVTGRREELSASSQ